MIKQYNSITMICLIGSMRIVAQTWKMYGCFLAMATNTINLLIRSEMYRTEELQRSMLDFAYKYINGNTHDNAKLLVDRITQTSCMISSFASPFVREQNSWRPNKSKFLEDVPVSCV